MIPIYLTLAGFLSYRDPVEIDFTAFDLACISGPNGAGKSSLLDAITWALFGQARKRDDSLINAQSALAEVTLTFVYEGNLYRLQRLKPREKTMLLEFHILQDHDPSADLMERLAAGAWKALTERTLRETEARIQETLRLDYDTFVNASFFLQGKADQFTQQRPSDRKRILGSILGLEVWERYRETAAQQRRSVEAQIESLDGRLHEIAAELGQEAERKRRLHELEVEMQRLSQERQAQETIAANIRQVRAALTEQERLVQTLQRQAELAERRLNESRLRLEERTQERQALEATIALAAEIEAAYAAWQEARARLEEMEQVASRFREQEQRRQAPRAELQAARARLEQERDGLRSQQQTIQKTVAGMEALRVQQAALQASLAAIEERLAQRAELDAALLQTHQRQTEARAENTRLKPEMDELKTRIGRLKQAEGAECPLCGQPLKPTERLALIEALEAQGKEKGDRYRANLAASAQTEREIGELGKQIASLGEAQTQATGYSQALAELSSQLRMGETQQADWLAGGAQRLAEVEHSLAEESFAPEARAQLAEIDAELKAIGYDAAAHDTLRQAELDGRASSEQLRGLETARAALAPLARECTELSAQLESQQAEAQRQLEEYQVAAAELAARQAQAPDQLAAERLLLDLQEKENAQRYQLGAAQQRLAVLDDLRARQADLLAQREALAGRVQQYKQLERAFGKDGVPALLIEQALPEIESRANDLLDRLSAGAMTVRFVTQAQYKDKRRDDMKETLEIQISDSAGTRDYEMFSGGEAFRVNFAIRLALSQVLAQRAGARLQTLVIDEGFGSQDTLGRQRLIEAINLVQSDFAKILVITHIDELKDAFPNRIEIEKTEFGSTARII